MIWETLLLGLHVVGAAVLIGFVLLQHGKGADMGAAFGSGSSGSLFGASGSANFLSRTTGVLAALFFICTLGLTSPGASRPAPSAGVMGATLNAPVPAATPAAASLGVASSPAATSRP